MRSILLMIISAFFAFQSTAVYGDALIRRLPADGAWARFYMNESWMDRSERTGWITISSVGEETIGKEKCRWIEWKFETEDGQQRVTSVFKFLIPEEHLKAGGDPLTHVVKAWRKSRDRDPVALEQIDIEALYPRLHLICEGPPIELIKKLEKKETVQWQKGKLECEVLLGTTQEEYEIETSKVRYRLRVNPKIPFGVAAATLEVDSTIGERGTLEFIVVDMGTGARSDLPEAN